jgi:hypothetical protein
MYTPLPSTTLMSKIFNLCIISEKYLQTCLTFAYQAPVLTKAS